MNMQELENRISAIRAEITFHRNRALELEDLMFELEEELILQQIAAEAIFPTIDPADNDPMDAVYAVSMREDLIRKYCGYARCNHGCSHDRTRSGKAKKIASLHKQRRNLAQRTGEFCD